MAAKKLIRKGRREKQKADLTEAEWEIIQVVWRLQPCTAGTVQDELTATKGWAYSTIKTTMDRMVQKGFLRVERLRNLQLFHASLTETQARLGEFSRMLQRLFNGALTPMMQWLVEHRGLSPDEAGELRRLIDSTGKPDQEG